MFFFVFILLSISILMRFILIFLFFSTRVFSQSENFQKGVQFFDTKEWPKSKEYFLKAVKYDYANYKAIEYLGDIAAYTKKWDEALGYYKVLVTNFDTNALYNFKYGGVLAYKAQASNKFKALTLVGDIKKHLHKAALLDTTHIETRWALVQLYTSLPKIVGGSESQSKKYANQLLKISKVDGYLALGYVNENNNKPENAEKFYKKALAVGRSEHTYKKLSSFYEKTNQPQKALNNYEIAYADLQRNHLNYLFGKVSAVYNISLEMGLVYLKRYIKNFTEKDGVPISWANYRIAQIYRHKDDKRNAYNFIQKALNENPNLEGALTEKKLILMMK